MKIGKVFQNKNWLVFSILLLSVLLLFSVLAACAKPAAAPPEFTKGFQTVKPETVGLSSERLNEIGSVLQADVQEGKINGAVLLVAREGKIAYFNSFGYRDEKKTLPMEKDSIFRIYSMTKSITAVAVAMLMEEGKLALTDPVEKYIPSFKDIQIGEFSKDAAGKDVLTMVKPSSVMTIHDLCKHTAGLGYWFTPPTEIQALYLQAGMDKLEGFTNAEVCDKIARLPLVENPGIKYRYGVSYDVLGRVIEVVSGMPLDKFFEQRIYEPLGMNDSGFQVTGEDVARLAYLDPEWGLYIDPTSPTRKYWSGGGGSVSTAMDFARFAQMLLNGGELEGKRLLKPETVAFITSDQLGPLGGRDDILYIPLRGFSVGFDFYVRVDTKTVDFPANIGEFLKTGAAGTVYFVYPKEKLVAVFMVSAPDLRVYYRNLIERMIYQAIAD
ncbi:MAG: beta-lactamase family protein [Chloroflexi bacterium]|nr:beta-lactamase family protein [Chloroflexota bacterium]MBM3166326.1 beta-lactamase family protein [Chloroflexota bacterium]MBM4452612.1 beta-lactamase family protein [Chloroflexota bacterium]